MKHKKMFIIIIFLISLSSSVYAQVIYSNSFESTQDTVGWSGYMEFRDDTPPDGGNQSVYISGGCIWPHAWIELGPFDYDGFYKVRCWGKNLGIGGSVSINDVEGFSPEVSVFINESEWTFYESIDTLFCPAGKRIVLSLGAGGIVWSAMLIDKVEVINVQSNNSQWRLCSSGTTEKLNDVVMLDPSTAIVVGSGGSILKTTDSGETWYHKDLISSMIVEWNSISFCDKNNGVIAGKNYIFTTTNGGEQWSPVYYSGEKNFISCLCLSLSNIYAGDDSGYVYNSVDTGKIWTSERITHQAIRSIYPLRGDFEILEIFALTRDSLFIKSEYPSTPWTEWGPLDYFQGSDSEASKGEYSEDGTAFIVGVSSDIFLPVIIRLRPQDSHWYSVGPENVSFGGLRDLSIPSANVIYASGVNGLVVKSSDSGDDWISLNTPTSQTLNSVYFFDNERGFAVGDSGVILYTRSGGISTSVREQSTILPNEFMLYQNYPNPFNPSTNFEFSVPWGRDLGENGRIASASGGGFVSLKIFNVLGKEVATIVNEELSAGRYKFQWDASGFASGIYFYTIKAGNFSITKKLVLLK
jgi:photosystem II stability/assembly factor-like uncharacterized protein